MLIDPIESPTRRGRLCRERGWLSYRSAAAHRILFDVLDTLFSKNRTCLGCRHLGDKAVDRPEVSMQTSVMPLRQRVGGSSYVVDIVIERDDVSRWAAGAGVEDDSPRSRGREGQAESEDRYGAKEHGRTPS
jgi:hypothetical protein